jgi:hypothetical protein
VLPAVAHLPAVAPLARLGIMSMVVYVLLALAIVFHALLVLLLHVRLANPVTFIIQALKHVSNALLDVLPAIQPKFILVSAVVQDLKPSLLTAP